jgi:hypothetical protein
MNSGYIHSHEKKIHKTELQSKEIRQIDHQAEGSLDNRVEHRFAESELPQDEKAKLSERHRDEAKLDPLLAEKVEIKAVQVENDAKMNTPSVDIKENPEPTDTIKPPTTDKAADQTNDEKNNSDDRQ